MESEVLDLVTGFDDKKKIFYKECADCFGAVVSFHVVEVPCRILEDGCGGWSH